MRDDIIRMAQEADYNPREGGVYKFDNFDLERFAALVAAAEREACAKLIESGRFGIGSMMSMHTDESVAEAIRARGQNDQPV